MSKHLLSHNPLTGVTEVFHDLDDGRGGFAIQTLQNVDAIIEQNKADYNDAPASWGEGRLVARIPMTVFFDLHEQGIVHDAQAFKRWLEDSDNRFFRCRPGSV